MKKYALMWVESPLQSWGYDSVFGRRETLKFPTRSGVFGLICCARGAGGEERDWLKKWSAEEMTVLSFPRSSNGFNVLCDFHMVGGGYDKKNPWQRLMIPRTSKGTVPNGGGSKRTYRYYLEDAAFAVILSLPEDGEDIMSALRSPVWSLYLGRKSCVPSDLIGRGVFDSFENAVLRAQQIADEKKRVFEFKVVERHSGSGDQLILKDMPVSFGSKKEYSERSVVVVYHE